MAWNYQNVDCSLKRLIYCVVYYNFRRTFVPYASDVTSSLQPRHRGQKCGLGFHGCHGLWPRTVWPRVLVFYAISTSAAAATGLYRYCLVQKNGSNEASKLWSHHEETRELPGEIDNARNNARCTQARKTTHGLDGQHQGVDRTPSGRVNQNDRGQR